MRVRFVLEHFDAYHQQPRTADFQKLGPVLLTGCPIYVWPETKRTCVNGQWKGSLHTKCVVQDSYAVFFTSAMIASGPAL